MIWKQFLIGTVLYKIKSLDGTKPNTNPKINRNPITNPIQLFYAFFEHRPMIFKLASFVRFFSPFQYGTVASFHL